METRSIECLINFLVDFILLAMKQKNSEIWASVFSEHISDRGKICNRI